MAKQKRSRIESEPTVRVRVFINLVDLARAWQFEHAKLTGYNLKAEEKANVLNESKKIGWESLPQAIIDQLDQMEYIGESPKELRAVDVYASADRKNDGSRTEFETWLDEELDPLAGYQVHTFLRKRENRKVCSHCDEPLDRTEFIKGLSTKVACDLLAHAVNDAYDIAVLVMDDAEIIPSVLSVQEIFDKQVIHIGPKGEGQELRSAAWGHVSFEDLAAELVSADDFKKRYNKANR
jgi:hypothetical protein